MNNEFLLPHAGNWFVAQKTKGPNHSQHSKSFSDVLYKSAAKFHGMEALNNEKKIFIMMAL